MKIDPDRLSSLRKKNRLTRLELGKQSGINKRTIQRLESESESQRGQKSQEHTVNSLAKALGVEPGVLTGELPFPESGKAPASDSERVQIGAQISPKVRLAYDLIKRRYDVSATEIINMAPLFFALLAEGSLAWRREKLKEVEETKSRLEQIDGFWRGGTLGWIAEGTLHDEGIKAENDSIKKADLFGEHLLSYDTYAEHFNNYFFYPSTDNPFASYLRKLKAKLDITDDDKVKVGEEKDGDLVFGSPLKFPDYDICCDELDGIANGSSSAKVVLEAGHVRLSEIPEELMAEDAVEERTKWFGDRLPDNFKDLEKKIKDLEKGMKDLEKEIKEKDDKIKEIEEMGRAETYPEGVSEEEFWKEGLKESNKRYKLWRELGHLEEKHREELSRLAILIKEERDRSTSLSDPEGDLEGTEEADSQETNSNIEKGGDDQ